MADNHIDFYVADLKEYKDGEVFRARNKYLIKWGNRCVDLHSLLVWPGLEAEMRKHPQKDLEMVHTFSGGVYLREMHIPKGTFIIGKRHRKETCNILLKGKLSVYLGDEKPVQVIEGPMIMTSEPMVRKIAYCHEDAVFINVHPTSKTDLDEIEKEFIITEEEAIQCLGEL